MKRIVICTFAAVGFHAWPGAPDEVKYLAAQHRHKFSFRVEVLVDHSDRDVEFHMLKRRCREELANCYRVDALTAEVEFGANSCEMIAEVLGLALKRGGLLGLRAIEVWEDMECGSRVEWP